MNEPTSGRPPHLGGVEATFDTSILPSCIQGRSIHVRNVLSLT